MNRLCCLFLSRRRREPRRTEPASYLSAQVNPPSRGESRTGQRSLATQTVVPTLHVRTVEA